MQSNGPSVVGFHRQVVNTSLAMSTIAPASWGGGYATTQARDRFEVAAATMLVNSDYSERSHPRPPVPRESSGALIAYQIIKDMRRDHAPSMAVKMALNGALAQFPTSSVLWCQALGLARNDIVAARFTFAGMLAAGVPPNVVTCTMLIGAYGAAGEVGSAIELLLSMRQNFGIDPNEHSFNVVLKALLKHGGRAFVPVLIGLMHRYRVNLNTVMVNLLITDDCRNGNLASAMQLLETMVRSQVACDRFTFGPIAKAVSQACHIPYGRRLREVMACHGFEPDPRMRQQLEYLDDSEPSRRTDASRADRRTQQFHGRHAIRNQQKATPRRLLDRPQT